MANLFDGYYMSRGKVPLEKINIENLKSEAPETGDYVGLLNPKYVQVDIDNNELADKVLQIVVKKGIKCDVLETRRGYHFYFKDTQRRCAGRKVGWFSAIGIPCDFGVGWKNLVIPLRLTYEEVSRRTHNGEVFEEKNIVQVTRRWIQTFDEVDEIPAWLLPISKSDNGILNLTSERNNTLFSYKLQLAKSRLSDDEIAECLYLINDYVLKDPLSDRELSTIARSENFDEQLFYDEKGRFKHDVFGNVLISSNNIVLVENVPYIYSNRSRLYSCQKDDFERAMIDKIPSLKSNQRTEVYKYVILQHLSEERFASPKFIGLKNDILNLETMELMPYGLETVICNKINYDYNPSAYCELMDKTIDKVMCGDKELRKLFEEMLGYLLYRENKFQVFFMLTGSGSNGKSTMLNLIKELVGYDNYSTLAVQELEERFKPAQLANKMVNIGDDLPDKYLTNSSILKSVVTGGTITVERKGEHPFDLTPRVKLVFACNNPPKTADKTDGLARRLMFIPFDAKFTKYDADYDPFIEDKLLKKESMEYLLKIAIDGLKRLLENNKFSDSDKSKVEKYKFEMDNNNVLEYLEDNPKLHLERRTDAYKEYVQWCDDNGYSAFNQKHFTNTVLEVCPDIKAISKTIDRKTQRIFYNEKMGGLK